MQKKTVKRPSKSSNSKEVKSLKESSQLMKLLENQLKDIYWAENALTKALPKMIKKATSETLIDALEKHFGETKEQIKRVEQIFSLMDKKPIGKKCEAMAGLIKEGEEVMKESEAGVMRDAGIIYAAQKVEHYEIASYGTMRQFAETLKLTEVMKLLESTLNEEKAADVSLTKVAVAAINMQAASLEV